MTTGADAIARSLVAGGVEIAFGLPGVHNMALWPAFERAHIRIVGSRHEQGCAYAADGYARATGRLGVALVTTGPGAANTLGAVGEAWASNSPIVVIATDIPSTQRRDGQYRGVLHECTDQAGMFTPVTKIQSRDIGDALRAVLAAPHGPGYFEVPTDLLAAPETSSPTTTAASDSDHFASIGKSVSASRRPLIWIGGGTKNAGAAIDTLARRIGAPVVATYSARGVLPAGHPHLVPGPPHEPQVIKLIEQADCTIVIGSDLDAMNTMAWKLPLPAPRVAINVDANDASKNYTMDAVVVGRAEDCDELFSDIAPREPWFGDMAAFGKEIRDEIRATPETAESMEFLERTEAALREVDPVVFADMCIAGYWLAGHYAVRIPRGLHYPMGWGTLGWAFPASIGAAAAGLPSVAFMGDGGMLFAIGELATVAQERLPLTVVVVDDGGYGMLRYPHTELAGCELAAVDFVAVARGFGIEAERIDGVGATYEDALTRAVASKQPRLLHVKAALYPPRTTSPRWPINVR